MECKIILYPGAGPFIPGRWSNILTGLVFVLVGLMDLFTRENNTYMIILNVCLISLGVYFMILSILLLAPESRFLPRIELDDEGILVKDDIFHHAKYINWGSISGIYLGRHKLSITLEHGKIISFRLKVRQKMIDGNIKNILKTATEKNQISFSDLYSGYHS